MNLDEILPEHKRGVDMSISEKSPMYSMTLTVRCSWQAHSLSNAGANGSNRLLPRRQLLSDGFETDACSGSIFKHQHAASLAEIVEYIGLPLCPACRARDGRRAAALVGREGYQEFGIERVVRECVLCDAHGFLITGKNADGTRGEEARRRLSKHSLIEFAWPLALPNQQAQTAQLMTRSGDSKEEGQMLMKFPSRSGVYAFTVRYKSMGIGVDTDKWIVLIKDEQQRLRRHQAILAALRDQLLSPTGALTSTMLPHLTGLIGALVVRKCAGTAAFYSALNDDFVERLVQLDGPIYEVIAFNGIDDFYKKMNLLIDSTYPGLPTSYLCA